MPRKKLNLKKRLDEVREEPAPPAALTIELDADLYQALKTLARQKRIPIETYISRILAKQVEDSGDSEG